MFDLHTGVLEPVMRGSIMYLSLFLLFRVVIRRRVGAIGMSDILLVVISRMLPKAAYPVKPTRSPMP